MVNVNLGDSLLVAGLHHTEAQAVVRAINRAAVSEYPVAWLIDPAGQGKPYLTLHDASKPAFWDGGKIPEGYVVKPLFAGTPLFAVVAPEGSPVERDECPKCGNHCLRPDKSCPSCSPVASEEAAKPIASTVFRDLTGDDWTPKPAAPVESEEA